MSWSWAWPASPGPTSWSCWSPSAWASSWCARTVGWPPSRSSAGPRAAAHGTLVSLSKDAAHPKLAHAFVPGTRSGAPRRVARGAGRVVDRRRRAGRRDRAPTLLRPAVRRGLRLSGRRPVLLRRVGRLRGHPRRGGRADLEAGAALFAPGDQARGSGGRADLPADRRALHGGHQRGAGDGRAVLLLRGGARGRHAAG